ncbi:hypothetical protein CE195_12640, partial [Sodalis-like symbiont of Philaenus spumarius]
VRPGSEAFPGKNELIHSYWSSLSIKLAILFFRKRQNVSRLFYNITALGYKQALDVNIRSTVFYETALAPAAKPFFFKIGRSYIINNKHIIYIAFFVNFAQEWAIAVGAKIVHRPAGFQDLKRPPCNRGSARTRDSLTRRRDSVAYCPQ